MTLRVNWEARTDIELSGAAGNPTANIMTQLENLAAAHPNITKLETIGHSLKGVPIYAMKVTKDADSTPDGTRPAVLYSSVQHAREWLAGETGRRTLRLFLDNYGRTEEPPSAPTASLWQASSRARSPSSSTRASCGSS